MMHPCAEWLVPFLSFAVFGLMLMCMGIGMCEAKPDLLLLNTELTCCCKQTQLKKQT